MNKVWLITGANSGFGRAITDAAVAAGDIAVATARRIASLDDVVGAYPGQVEATSAQSPSEVAMEVAAWVDQRIAASG